MAREIFLILEESDEADKEPYILAFADTLEDAELELEELVRDSQQSYLLASANGEGLNAMQAESLGSRRTFFVQKFVSKGLHGKHVGIGPYLRVEGTLVPCQTCGKKSVSEDYGRHNYRVILGGLNETNVLSLCEKCFMERKWQK